VKSLRVIFEQCTGCESCVLSCTFEHEGLFDLVSSRIRIDRDEEQAEFRPRVCIQCDERFCVAVCPTGALTVDRALGIIRVDATACIGCRACGEACPYGGVQFIPGRGTPLICDLCGGDPVCVKTCQKPQALQFGEERDSNDG